SPLTLTVSGYRGETLVFTGSTTVGFSLRSVSSFIQTDRSHYEPVKCFYSLGSLISSWFAQHPSGNVAESWASAGRQGIVLKDFSLPEAAPVGQWTIKTTMNVKSRQHALFLHFRRQELDSSQIFSSFSLRPHRCLSLSNRVVLELKFICMFLFSIFISFQAVSLLTRCACVPQLSVSRYDGKPLASEDRMLPVVAEITQTTSALTNESETLTFPAPEDGNVQIKFRLQDQVVSLSIRVSIFESRYQRGVRAPLGKQARGSFTGRKTSSFRLHTSTLVTAGTRNSSSLSLTPALSWSPEACVTVYCVLSDGEVISDSVHLSLTWSGDRARPGRLVSLTLSALEPGAKVGVVVTGRHDDPPPRSDLDLKVESPSICAIFTDTFLNMINKEDTISSKYTYLSRQQLAVSKDFSLSLDVPPQLIRGEEIVLEVNVVNHLEEYIDVCRNPSLWFSVLAVGITKRTRFPIRPLSLGDVEIAVDAVSAEASESLVRRITVKPEGVEQFSSQTLFLELDPARNFSSTPVSFSFPPDVVPGSQRAHVALVGDVLALSINNMGSLVQMPLGCGEQNMIHFAPSAYFLHYLNMSKKRYRENAKEKTQHVFYMLQQGYRKQLLYRRDDGSFSGFGSRDASGSTWLTAFVLRCFILAKPYMHIDQKVLDSARTWLIQRQGPDGEFSEAGRVIHTQMQEGIDRDSVALTAYVLVQPAHVTLAQTYLENKVSGGGVSNYSLGLAAYALALTGSPVTVTVLDELNRRADDTVKMWSTSPGSSSHEQQWHSSQIEMVSYVLLAQLSRGGFVEGIALMKWLTRQLSSFGGFGTTQVRVKPFNRRWHNKIEQQNNTIELNFNISFIYCLWDQISKLLTAQEELCISAFPGEISHLLSFNQFCIFEFIQLNVFYNLEAGAASRTVPPVKEAFYLHVNLTDDGDHSHMILSICTKLKDSEAIPRTGMVIMDVCMLSGFALSPGAAASAELIRKVEIKPDKISLYLDSVSSQVCIQLPIVRKFKVARTQDAAVLVYDYYEPSEYSRWLSAIEIQVKGHAFLMYWPLQC
uniref:CD109 molecule n=1 Tax=Salarias fasciatus TaxID=181472 RepID=A0A672II71_SALFA